MGDEMRYTSKPAKTRSVADGQSQHSFSNHSGRYLTSNAFSAGLVNSRPGNNEVIIPYERDFDCY